MKTITKLIIMVFILAFIKLAGLDTVLVGENFWMTAYCIFIGLGLLIFSMDKKDEEIQHLRYKLRHPEDEKQNERLKNTQDEYGHKYP